MSEEAAINHLSRISAAWNSDSLTATLAKLENDRKQLSQKYNILIQEKTNCDERATNISTTAAQGAVALTTEHQTLIERVSSAKVVFIKITATIISNTAVFTPRWSSRPW